MKKHENLLIYLFLLSSLWKLTLNHNTTSAPGFRLDAYYAYLDYYIVEHTTRYHSK